jgi:hypothetical protein
MTEHNHLASLFTACWKDEALKARLISDPKGVLSEFNLPVPDGVDIKVVENSDNCIHITLPANPMMMDEMSDEELGKVAGGHVAPTPLHSCNKAGHYIC